MVIDLITGLPKDLRTVLRLIRSGSFRVQVDLDDLERFADRIDQSLSWLAMSGK